MSKHFCVKGSIILAFEFFQFAKTECYLKYILLSNN